MKRRIGGGHVELLRGNIVEQRVDAIVNAANTWMLGGGGVDGAVHAAAGPALLAECKRLPVDAAGRRCPTGETRTTGAGALDARHVIHAVGPVYDERHVDEVEQQLRAVHVSALAAAADHECASIAFPAISTGAYRFPIARAATIALDAVADFQRGPRALAEVRFVLFSAADLAVFERALVALDH
jgi:O-acetyl-ADP-ribose deacetylase (regulator of RNase III)